MYVCVCVCVFVPYQTNSPINNKFPIVGEPTLMLRKRIRPSTLNKPQARIPPTHVLNRRALFGNGCSPGLG